MANTYWTGKKRSEETRKKISQAQIGRKQPLELIEKRIIGIRKTGKSRQSYNYQEWRRRILERDKNKCVKCDRQHEKMHCHHIKPWKEFPELRFSVENGETLCASCHIRIGKENREIKGELTEFKKGQISPRKGIKTGKPSWNRGIPISKEAKEKMIASKIGSIPWNKGIPCRDETRKKISDCNKGKPSHMKDKNHSEETKEKCRLANLGKNLSPRTQFKKGLIPWNKKEKMEK